MLRALESKCQLMLRKKEEKTGQKKEREGTVQTDCSKNLGVGEMHAVILNCFSFYTMVFQEEKRTFFFLTLQNSTTTTPATQQ